MQYSGATTHLHCGAQTLGRDAAAVHGACAPGQRKGHPLEQLHGEYSPYRRIIRKKLQKAALGVRRRPPVQRGRAQKQ
jgi:hypothetical protein